MGDVDSFTTECIPPEIVDNHIISYLSWREKIGLHTEYRNLYHKCASRIQRIWRFFRSIRQIMNDQIYDRIFDAGFMQGPPLEIDPQVIYERMICWYKYCLYTNRSDQQHIPGYVSFVINKLANAGLLNREKEETLWEIYEKCQQCKTRKYICYFIALAKDILTPYLLIYAGL